MGSFYYVYILRDVATGKRHYTGVTHDLQERLGQAQFLGSSPIYVEFEFSYHHVPTFN